MEVRWGIVDDFEPLRPARGKLAELERKIELAIDLGDQRALDAATAAIEVLDRAEGNADEEPCPCGEDTPTSQPVHVGWGVFWGSLWADADAQDRTCTYGLDQSKGPLSSSGTALPRFDELSWRG